jgi:hypothetical protein
LSCEGGGVVLFGGWGVVFWGVGWGGGVGGGVVLRRGG